MYDILVVDDDLFALALLEEQLKNYGDFFTPVYASNGKEAVEILSQVEISLLVTDLIMPGDINGWHLIEYIENFHPNIPIIVITGCKDEEKVAELDGRVREILLKPIRVKQLVKIVTNILNEDIASGNLKGVSVGSFLQLLEMDEKTCLLEVGTSPQNKGLLYIHQGKLYDAEYGDLQEYDAACRLIAMDNVSFKIKALPKLEIRRRIKGELMSIIMDAMKMKDEVKDYVQELPPQQDDKGEEQHKAFEADWRKSLKEEEEKEKEEELRATAMMKSATASFPQMSGDEQSSGSRNNESGKNISTPTPTASSTSNTPGYGESRNDNDSRNGNYTSRDKSSHERSNARSTANNAGHMPLASCSTENCTITLESILQRLRGIKGYKGSGIMNFTGETIASDCLVAHLDIAGAGAVFNDIFRSAQETAVTAGLYACQELTLRTKDCIIILCASGAASAVPFHLIAILDKDGNQALAKMQLTKIIPLAAQELN
ncbi:MAG: response regulator [Candidatus Electrothrix sp. AW2]|nr:response regulator [Candidatus Electrothrix gigas]MCI5226596.1 response regulator [Candidatus Electrothrix gigas]